MYRKIIILAVLAAVLLTSVLPAAAQSAASSQCAMFHTVQRGDTLSKLARTFNVTVAQLTGWNSITNANRIYAGQTLCVGRQTIIDDSASGQTYTVQAGDTLNRIARRYGVDVTVLARVNNLRNPNLIYAGQVLRIPDVTIQ